MTPRDLMRIAGRQPGNSLAIFAMLMVLLGPLIGQGSAWVQRATAAEAPDHCIAIPATEHGNGHAKAHLHDLMDACGYCSLFFHTPGIPQGHAGLYVRAVANSYGSPFSLRLAARAAPVFPGAMSHAPPVQSMS